MESGNFPSALTQAKEVTHGPRLIACLDQYAAPACAGPEGRPQALSKRPTPTLFPTCRDTPPRAIPARSSPIRLWKTKRTT